nr:MAG TPA: hypothetical protein [Caudoviricetes sp.]
MDLWLQINWIMSALRGNMSLPTENLPLTAFPHKMTKRRGG